jgi:kinesin family protein 5
MQGSAQAVLQTDVCAKVIHFCDWRRRAYLASLNRTALGLFAAHDAHWAWMCRLLSEESLLFCPPALGNSPSWRDFFLELYPSRMLFQASHGLEGETSKDLLALVGSEFDDTLTGEEEAICRNILAKRLKVDGGKPQTFEVKVVARMKPAAQTERDGNEAAGGAPKHFHECTMDMGVSVTLPLHQRLQLIQSERKCSQREARRILWEGSGCADPWADCQVKALPPPGVADENAPANQKSTAELRESADQDDKVQACVVAVTRGLQGAILMCCPGSGLREFTFDAVLGEDSTQNEVYESAPRRMVVDFINGKNSSIFAFGQTGSGKTHTMFGPDHETGAELLMIEAEGGLSASGIIPRACSDVLRVLAQRRAQGVAAVLRVSYVEIYGEQVTDLLNENANVGQWHGVAHRAMYKGECAIEVQGAEHLRELLLKGDDAKRRAATAMNQRSSRAHCLLMLSLSQVRAASEGAQEVESFLVMADLGGSEQVLKSGVASLSVKAGGFLEADVRLKEAVNINLGLLALKTCIRHLVDKCGYVPYQNSRLTMMMSAVLASDCRTAVVITGSSDRKNALETMLTLRFGEECSQVIQTSSNSIAAAARAIKALDVEIEKIEEVIRGKERWETVRTTREDALHQADEATQAIETVVITKMVGAEKERANLETLLARRRILSGL